MASALDKLKVAEIKKLTAEARLMTAQALDAERTVKDLTSRVIIFSGEIENIEATDLVKVLHDLSSPPEPITIQLNSVGGDLFEGLMMFDYIKHLREKGLRVTTETYGLAASMASVISQAGDERLISPNSWFMIHEPSTIVIGKSSAIRDEAVLIKKMHAQLCTILAERATLTVTQIQKNCDRRDWWMTAEEAVNNGFFDGYTT